MGDGAHGNFAFLRKGKALETKVFSPFWRFVPALCAADPERLEYRFVKMIYLAKMRGYRREMAPSDGVKEESYSDIGALALLGL